MERTPTPPPQSGPSGSHDLTMALAHPVVPRVATDLIMLSLPHEHPLIPFTRFVSGSCQRCRYVLGKHFYVYGGYRCNELGCGDVVFHKECIQPLQEINHSYHPHHSLKLVIQDSKLSRPCSICEANFRIGYSCSTCDFKLDFFCARRQEEPIIPANSYRHHHPLRLVDVPYGIVCYVCRVLVRPGETSYGCHRCKFVIHVDCIDFYPEAYHSSHPQHPLKSLKYEVPHYADKKCLLCATKFDDQLSRHIHHCDVCNFSICRVCMKYPPPIDVECPTTHEHRLHLVPRRIDFTCNACGTQGDRSPYFCLQCNFMIHRQCIGLPRVININRHDHRITYTRYLGHGEWKCRVCREKVDGFYGAYKCAKCPTLAVHSLCATRSDVWDMVEREGTPEEEEIAPFVVIDDTTIKHFSHDHNLRINEDGQILPESTLCVACVSQILSKPFYKCEQCDFILHKKCAHLPRKKRHVLDNLPFTLQTDARHKTSNCRLCLRDFTGFRYKSDSNVTIDVRCGSKSDSLKHKSHQHPLYYSRDDYSNHPDSCSHCGGASSHFFCCFECDYFLDAECALLPQKVMKIRYDDHPLFLWFGDKDVEGVYWCEACETKLDPKKWFYTCNDCGVALHISCVVGDFSYIMPGSLPYSYSGVVVSNNSICRTICSECNSRCKLPSILKYSEGGDDTYSCSRKCLSWF